jgi:hypothetical protein
MVSTHAGNHQAIQAIRSSAVPAVFGGLVKGLCFEK